MSVKKVLGAWLLLACVVMGSVQLSAAELPESAQKYFELAKEGKDEAAMKKLGDTALTDVGKESEALNEFAWKILTDDGLKSRDLVFAMKVAKAAYDESEGKNAAIVDTYARAFADSGKVDEAIKLQKKAIELCQDDNLKNELEETLKGYEKKLAEKKPADKKPDEKKPDEKK